jgi:hypothetical protein
MSYIKVNGLTIHEHAWEENLKNAYTKWHEDVTDDLIEFDGDLENNGMIHPNGYAGGWEVSLCNLEQLKNQFMRVRDRCRAIIEIGVHRNDERSQTHVFLNNKLPETKYFGIDIVDKSFLNDPSKNIFTIQSDSSHTDKIWEWIQSHGVTELDFIYIDGYHSINQVKRDWEFTRYMSSYGIVGFHDTTCHPGPKEFVRVLDRNKWIVEENVCPDDWGIGFAWKK